MLHMVEDPQNLTEVIHDRGHCYRRSTLNPIKSRNLKQVSSGLHIGSTETFI